MTTLSYIYCPDLFVNNSFSMKRQLFTLTFFLVSLIVAGQCPPTVTITSLSGTTTINGTNVSFCAGDSVLLTCSPASGVTFQWYNGVTSIPGATNFEYYPNAAGSYTVLVSGCGTPSTPVVVSLKPLPTITITPSIVPPRICSGESITMTVTVSPSNVSWVWLQPGSPPGQYGNQNPLTLILFGSTTYQVVGVDNSGSNGCSNTASMFVQVDNPIYGGAIAAPQEICYGETPEPLTSTALPTGGNGTYTYRWQSSTTSASGPFTNIPGATGLTYAPGPLFTTTWFIRLAFSPPCSEGLSNVLEITVDSIPSITSSPDTAICTGQNLNYIPTADVVGTSFTWTASVTSPGVNVTGFTSSGSGNITDPLFLDPGETVSGEVTYVITPVGPDPTNCDGTPANLVVTVDPLPSVTNSVMSQTICSAGTTTPVTFTSGVAGTTFSWYATAPAGISGFQASGTGGLPAQTIFSTLLNPEYVTYYITPIGPVTTNCNGIEVPYSVLVNPSPTVTNTPMYQNICSGNTSAEVVLTSNVTGTNFVWTAAPTPGSITGYTASGGDTIPPQTLINPTTTTGYVTYSILPSGSIGACPATPQDYIIYVHPIPNITSSLTGAVCSGSQFSYTITSDVTGTGFQWSRPAVSGIFNPPASGTGSTINETLTNITINPVQVPYVLTPTGPTPASCPGNIDTLWVTVRPLPIVNAGNDTTIPCGTSCTLNGTATGGTGTLSYAWVPSSLIASGVTTLTPTTVNLTSSNSFTLTVTDSEGCSKTDVVQVNVSGLCLSASPTATPSTICFGQTSNLNANATGGSLTYTYSWTSNPAGFSSTSATPAVTPAVTTTYTVIVDDGFSTVSGSATVTVNPLPSPFAVTGGGAYCYGGVGVPVGLGNSQTNSINYQLYLGLNPVGSPVPGAGGAISFGNVTTVGTYTVVATNTLTGCNNPMTGNAVVSINPLPIVNAGPDQVIPYGTSTSLSGTASGGTGALSYSWIPLAYIASGQTTLTPATTNLFFNTQYTLTVTDAEGCSNSDNAWVYLDGDPLSVTVTASDTVICNDGTTVYLQATAAGGSGSYVYSWTSNPPGFISTSATPTVNPTVTTIFSVDVNDGFNTVNGSVTVHVDPLPASYNLTGGGSYCQGGSGLPVGLDNSDIGVLYQLFRGGAPYGTAISGTGSAITFGNQTVALPYTVKATDLTTGCTNFMNGTAIITILPLPTAYTVTGGGSYPAGGVGVPIGLAGSQIGISYRLIHSPDTLTPAPGIAGTGGPITFGNQTLEGTYIVFGINDTTGCTNEMAGSVFVTINLNPTLFTVTGGGEICIGSPGVSIGLTGSEIGVNYQLKRDGINTGTPVAGTSNPLDFGVFTNAGTYTVLATNATTLTTRTMNGSAIIVVHLLPTVFTLGPAGMNCAGTNLRLNGSQAGVYYILYRGIDSVTMAWGTGVAGFLYFGAQTEPGIYTSVAFDSATGCSVAMNGAPSIHAIPLLFNVTPAGILCAGETIGVDGSQTGVMYQLIRDGIINVGPPVAGTGSAISFGPITVPGIYTVQATNTAPPYCSRMMNGTRILFAHPISFSMTPAMDTCAPVVIGLNGSEVGVTYYLHLDGAIPAIDSLAGTGLPISFGLQNLAGNYTINARNDYSLCDTLMNGVVTIYPNPDLFNVIPAGPVCAGTVVGLDDSEIGAMYELRRNDTIVVGIPVAGTGLPINFGAQTVPGTYTIYAYWTSSPSCSRKMTGSAFLYPKPTLFSLNPTGSHCVDTELTLSGSQSGIKYYLILNNLVGNPVDSVMGTGSVISFGLLSTPGTYTVLAYNPVIPHCQQMMNGNIVITPSPVAYNMTPAGIHCEPFSIGLDGSETGVSYELLDGGLPMVPPVIVAGTGNAISFGLQTAGTYSTRASMITTGCNIMMFDTVIINPLPTIAAGADTAICEGTVASLHATATNYSTVLWTTSGSGSFGSPTQLTTTYTPGLTDILTGSVTLTVSVNGTSVCSSQVLSDQLLLTIIGLPEAFAGPDATICITDVFALNGSATNYATVTWSTSGNGVFSNIHALDPVYTPGTLDQAAGSAILTLTATGFSACTSEVVQDQMTLTYYPLPIADAGPDASVCNGFSYQLAGQALYSSSVQWTTTGDGLFNNPGVLNSTYTPGLLDRAAGIVSLVLTANGSFQCTGQNSTDTIQLSIDPLPQANAGPDTTICASSSYHIQSQAVNYTSVLWSTAGDGLFDDPNQLQPFYTPGQADTINGSVTLTLTVMGALTCTAASAQDQMVLSFTSMPVVDAGPDVTICSGQPEQLNGTASHYSSIIWLTGGDGIFSDPNILNPTYTPGTLDILNGSAVLVLVAYGSELCAYQINSDSLTLSIHEQPTASISGSTSICSGQNAAITIQLTGTAPWSVTYTNGTTPVTVNSIPTTPYTFFVSPTATTTYTLTAISDVNCDGIYSGSAVITVNSSPSPYGISVSNGGRYCVGGPGVTISLDDSDPGVLYQLYFGGLPNGDTVHGTGSAITLGVRTSPGYYKVRGTDITSLCKSWMTDSVLVSVFPIPIVDFYADTTCVNELVQFQITGPDIMKIIFWSWNFGDGATATYNYPYEPTHTYNATGYYQVTLTVTDSNGCARTIIHPVNIHPTPVSFFSYSTPTCHTEPIHFNDLSYTTIPDYIARWIWDFGDGTDTTIFWPSNPDIDHLFPGPGLYDVSLTATSHIGCPNTLVRQIEIGAAPFANFTWSAPCDSEVTQFTDLTQSNGGGSIVEWYYNFGDPTSGSNNTSTQQNPVHAFTGTGIFNVRLITVNSHGCSDTIIKQVSVSEGPQAIFLVDMTCFGSITTFTDLSIPNAASIIEWDWNFGDGSAHSMQQNPIHLYLLPGTYQVTLLVKNSNLCTHDTTMAVLVQPLPTAQFQTNAPVCVASPVSFTNLSTTLVGQIVTWAWDFGDGTDTTIYYPGNPSIQHAFVGIGLQHTVRLTVTRADSCSSYIEHTIPSTPGPVANFFFSSTTCSNQPVLFTDISQLNGGSQILTWLWNFDDPTSGTANTSTQQNPIHTFTTAGTYNVLLTVTNIDNCVDTILKQIVINQQPLAAFTADTACLGSPTQFTDQSVPNTGSIITWDWNFGDGAPHQFIANPQHTYAYPGLYQVTLIVTNSSFCSKSITHSVKVNDVPFAAFTYSTQSCANAPVSFMDQSTTSQGYIVKWTWNFGDGNLTTVLHPNPPNVTHIYASGGNYNVILTVQTNDSCSSSVMHPVTVNAAPAANFDFPAANCETEAVQFTDLSQTNGGGPIVNWNWNFGDPGSGTNNLSTLQNPVHVYIVSGSYDVTLIVKNTNFCYDTILKPVTVTDNPVADFSADTACVGGATQFTDVSSVTSGTITGWNWNFGDGTIGSTLQNPAHTYLDAGIYTVTLIVTSSDGCVHDTSHQVEVLNVPVAMFSYTGECMGGVTQFTDQSTPQSGLISSWYWEFGDGDTSTLQNPTHTYASVGIYNVMLLVSNSEGCFDSITLPVTVLTPPVAAYSFYSTYCPDGQVSFSDQSTSTGVPITEWYWTFEPGYNSSAPNPVYTFSQTDTNYLVTLVVTDLNGCQDTMIDSVFVVPGFAFTFQATTACLGIPTQFEPVNLALGDTLHNVAWTFGEPSSGTNNTSTFYYPEHTYATAGSYIVKFKAWNTNNCVDSVYKQVDVNPLPIADFSFDPVAYCDTIVTFHNLCQAVGSPIDTLIWEFGDGTDTLFYNTIPLDITHQYPTFGIYDVTVTAISMAGCRDIITQQVQVSCINAVVYPADTLYCQRTPMVLIDSSSPVNLINEWSWNFGDGTDTTYTQYIPEIEHTWTTTGTFLLTLVIQSTSNGFTVYDTSLQTVHVKASPIAGFLVDPVCFGDTSRFINLSDSNGVHIQNLLWNFGNPASGIYDTTSIENPVHTYTTYGEFITILSLANALGCVDTFRMPARVYQLPEAAFTHSKACTRYDITFTDMTLIGDTTIWEWRWHFGDPAKPNDTITGPDPTHRYNQAGQYEVFLKVFDYEDCYDTTSQIIEVLQSPLATFTITENIDGMTGKIELTNESTGALAYSWDFGNGRTSSEENPRVTYEDDGEYLIRLVAWNEDGCYDTTTLSYEFVFQNLFVPNAFSPLNVNLGLRLFKPIGVNLQQYHVAVFNNRGHLMWESSALDKDGRPIEGWDGTFEGNVMPEGNYMWQIQAVFKTGKVWEGSDIGKGAPATMGTVMLIR